MVYESVVVWHHFRLAFLIAVGYLARATVLRSCSPLAILDYIPQNVVDAVLWASVKWRNVACCGRHGLSVNVARISTATRRIEAVVSDIIE